MVELKQIRDEHEVIRVCSIIDQYIETIAEIIREKQEVAEWDI